MVGGMQRWEARWGRSRWLGMSGEKCHTGGNGTRWWLTVSLPVPWCRVLVHHCILEHWDTVFLPTLCAGSFRPVSVYNYPD